MLVVICYDVQKNRIRSRLVKYLERIAVRIQYSVFLGDLSSVQINELKTYAVELFAEDGPGDLQVFSICDTGGIRERYFPARYIYI